MKYLDQLNLGGIVIPFGTEIEFKGPELSEFFDRYKHLPMEYIYLHVNEKLNFDKWYLDIDGTVTEKKQNKKLGGELSSKMFYNEKSDWEELILFCNALKESGAYIDGDCSNHISVCADFIKENKKILLLFSKIIAVFENEITYFTYGEYLKQRKQFISNSNIVAGTLLNNLRTLNFEETESFRDLTYKLCHENYGRTLRKFSAINLDFLWDKQTIGGGYNRIEFRYPNGSINPVIIQNNINFFLKIILAIINNRFDLDYLNFVLNKYQEEYFQKMYFWNALNSENIKKLCEAICLDSADIDNFGEQFDRVLRIKGIRDIK